MQHDPVMGGQGLWDWYRDLTDTAVHGHHRHGYGTGRDGCVSVRRRGTNKALGVGVGVRSGTGVT
jgi:hypothetical protein